MEWKSNIFRFSGSTSNTFQCSWGVIPKTLICNGINNCGDNSDEENCENFAKTSTIKPLETQPAISTRPLSTSKKIPTITQTTSSTTKTLTTSTTLFENFGNQ